MALVVKDRVRESSATTGTGTITLSGAYVGFVSFATAVTDGSTVFYCIHNTAPGVEDEGGFAGATFAKDDGIVAGFDDFAEGLGRSRATTELLVLDDLAESERVHPRNLSRGRV